MGAVGHKLRQLREEAGLTQKELGEKLNVRDATISRYEKGLISISADDLPRLATALGVSPAAFFEDDLPSPAEQVYAGILRLLRETGHQVETKLTTEARGADRWTRMLEEGWRQLPQEERRRVLEQLSGEEGEGRTREAS